ncbi:MAG TPA: sulfite exporter TauE/SafE family protein [Gemmatimonadales bacterium]|nr:sulfite exporter TauE/SafE family protein [Gemmatimonadales bacterium]
MTLFQFGAASVIVAVGAALQGTIGFGLALVSAPLLLLVDPRLVPGPLLCASGLLTVLMARRDWASVQGEDLTWSIGGRVAGTVAALAVLTVMSAGAVDLLFGALILLGVALSASGVHLRPAPRVLIAAGALSGFMGTLTSIGGPAIALVYQHEPGPRIRGTLSAFFVVGVVISVAGLAAIGRFGREELVLGATLLPGIVIGYLASHRTAGALDQGYIRPAVLVVSAAAAIAVILRDLWVRFG